jgi:glycosyltransferase involved in cell wall biosynthesis
VRLGISAPHRASTPRSGVGRYVQELARAMLAIDPTHEYVLFTDEPYLPALPANARWEIVPGGTRLSRLLWDHGGIKDAARRAGLDVLLAAKTVLPRALPCRGVATVHDLAFLRLPGYYPWDFRLYWNRVMHALAASDHHFVCVSETTARDVRELLGVAEERVHAIPSAIDPERFVAPARDVLLDRLGALRVPWGSILFVGNLIPRKNIARLLEAYRLVRARRDVPLVLAGADLMGVRPEPGVIPAGDLADEDLACLYASAGVLAFPSLYEGFGFPILEAMAAGCPVVTSGAGAMKEVAGDAARFVDPADARGIADGLLEVLDDPGLADRLRAAGRERVKAFDWKRTARETLAVLAGTAPARPVR